MCTNEQFVFSVQMRIPNLYALVLKMYKVNMLIPSEHRPVDSTVLRFYHIHTTCQLLERIGRLWKGILSAVIHMLSLISLSTLLCTSHHTLKIIGFMF